MKLKALSTVIVCCLTFSLFGYSKEIKEHYRLPIFQRMLI